MTLIDIARGGFALATDITDGSPSLVQVLNSVSVQDAAPPNNVIVVNLRTGAIWNLPGTMQVLRVTVRHTVTGEFS